jgi:hypothetical protein
LALNYRISLQIFYWCGALAGLVAGCRGQRAPGSAAAEIEPPAPAKAAPAPLRRLTAEQYRRSVRDLLGVSGPFLEGVRLPLDEGTAGFFANTLAPVSELQLDQYGRAAEAIAKEVTAQLPALAGRVGDCGGDVEGACVDRFIERFGRRVYRRPLGGDERKALRALYDGGRREGGATEGYKLVVQALLSSPHFLYLVENAPAAPGDARPAPAVQPVTPFALAARLAYFLWGSTPDAALLEAAEKGHLGTVAGLRAETARLMRDDRFRDSLASFHLQWLDLTELPAVEKRNKIYPLFTPALRTAMQEETTRFADRVITQEDGKVETLLNGRFSVLGGGLFELYGLPVPADKGATWQRVDLQTSHRAGLLSQASFLTMHAHWDKPSLVLRGKTIRERLLCTDLPPPPPDVNNTPPPLDPKVSMRERFEDHRSEVSCARCHRLIDPLGIPFESYDAIGALRTMDGPVPVDPTSELAGTAHSDGPVKNAEELAARLAGSDEVRDCLVKQWFRYALGRDVGAADATSLAQLRQIFKQADSRIPALIAAIPTTDSFRYVEVMP